MEAKRSYYPTKAAWAAAKAVALQREIRLLPIVRSSDWRGVQARMRALRSMRMDARRYERMAERYRLAGL